jgi:hypothetical protein
MTIHAYPLDALVGDYARAAAGLALSAGPLAALRPGPLVSLILGGLALLFAAFLVRTLLRHLTRLELFDDRIVRAAPVPAAIPWDDLAAVKLRYYTTHRDGRDGWLHLVLGGAHRRIAMDSRLAGFDAILRRAAREAGRRHLALGPATAANFAALGLDVAGGVR